MRYFSWLHSRENLTDTFAQEQKAVEFEKFGVRVTMSVASINGGMARSVSLTGSDTD